MAFQIEIHTEDDQIMIVDSLKIVMIEMEIDMREMIIHFEMIGTVVVIRIDLIDAVMIEVMAFLTEVCEIYTLGIVY